MKKDNLYFCFRYKCKNCPKSKECEEKEKRLKNGNNDKPNNRIYK